jgi:hypothetical protein
MPSSQPTTPVEVKNVALDAGFQNTQLKAARQAVLNDLGRSVPEIPFQDFLDYLAPPKPSFNLDGAMQSLKEGPEPALTSSTRWSGFPNDPKHSSGTENAVFGPMSDIFKKVVAAIVANSDETLMDKCTVDFLHNLNRAPTSAEVRNESRPDGYLVPNDRAVVMSKDGKGEVIQWADITLSCEYKKANGVTSRNDVRIHQGL